MPVTISLNPKGDRIFMVSTYPTPGIGKTCPGSRFSTHGGAHWSIPMLLENCIALRERFADDLRVDKGLADWYRAAWAERERLATLANAEDAELKVLPRLAPELAAAMESRTYQRSGVRFAADAGACLIADDPGLGKTLIGIGTVVESQVPGPYLVICPKTAVESVWARELPRWLRSIGPEVVTVPDGRAKRDAILDGLVADYEIGTPQGESKTDKTWVVVHPEMIRTKSWWVCKECGSETQKSSKPKELVCRHDPRQAPVRDDHTFPQLFDVEWGAIIVDESDRALIRLTGTPNQTRNGAELLKVRSGGLRLAMSGTPFRGKPHLLWSTLNWLDSKKYGGKWRWVQQFWKCGGYSGYEIGDLISEDAEQRLWDSLKGIVLRRTKSEVAKDLPPKTYVGTPLWEPTRGPIVKCPDCGVRRNQWHADDCDRPNGLAAWYGTLEKDDRADSPVGVWLPMSPPQAKAYKQMEDASVAAIAGGDLSAIGVLAEMTRMKQFATSAGRMVGTEFVPALPSNKFDWLVEALLEWGFPDDPCTKVIVTSQFTQVLNMFAAELLKVKDGRKATPIKSLMLTGETRNRAALIDRFNDPTEGPHLLFLQHKTGGVAITIDSADKMVHLDESDVDTMTQVEDRIHRVSKPRNVEYYYLRSVGTIEVGTAMVNAERGKDSRRLLDERRGVEYARRVMELSR